MFDFDIKDKMFSQVSVNVIIDRVNRSAGNRSFQELFDMSFKDSQRLFSGGDFYFK